MHYTTEDMNASSVFDYEAVLAGVVMLDAGVEKGVIVVGLCVLCCVVMCCDVL